MEGGGSGRTRPQDCGLWFIVEVCGKAFNGRKVQRKKSNKTTREVIVNLEM